MRSVRNKEQSKHRAGRVDKQVGKQVDDVAPVHIEEGASKGYPEGVQGQDVAES